MAKRIISKRIIMQPFVIPPDFILSEIDLHKEKRKGLLLFTEKTRRKK